MTTMAVTSAPLRRLFGRLDFAPQPHEPELARVLDAWIRLRAGQVAPQVPLPVKALGRQVSAFIRAPRARDYVLEFRGAELSGLLGDLQQGMMLSAAPNRRQAVRLRRLFEVVIQNGEPVLATFASGDDTDRRSDRSAGGRIGWPRERRAYRLSNSVSGWRRGSPTPLPDLPDTTSFVFAWWFASACDRYCQTARV